MDCLIDSAYEVNSIHKYLCIELNKLRKFFCPNGFVIRLIDECISKKLDSILQTCSNCSFGFKTDHCKIPYVSNFYNEEFKSDVLKLVSEFFPK